MDEKVFPMPSEISHPSIIGSWCIPHISATPFVLTARPVCLRWCKSNLGHIDKTSRIHIPWRPLGIRHHCHKWYSSQDAWVKSHWICFQCRFCLNMTWCHHNYPPGWSWRHRHCSDHIGRSALGGFRLMIPLWNLFVWLITIQINTIGLQGSTVLHLYLFTKEQHWHAVLDITCGHFLTILGVVPISVVIIFTLLLETRIFHMWYLVTVQPIVWWNNSWNHMTCLGCLFWLSPPQTAQRKIILVWLYFFSCLSLVPSRSSVVQLQPLRFWGTFYGPI